MATESSLVFPSHDQGREDIRKAIHHLHFELDVLTSKTRTGALSPTGVRK